MKQPLGRYYLYFSHHAGKYIRLAYADRLEGPWKMQAGGVMRIAFGGLVHRPWRAFTAERAIRDGAGFAEAADAELAEARPLRDNAYKLPMARAAMVQVLAELAG